MKNMKIEEKTLQQQQQQIKLDKKKTKKTINMTYRKLLQCPPPPTYGKFRTAQVMVEGRGRDNYTTPHHNGKGWVGREGHSFFLFPTSTVHIFHKFFHVFTCGFFFYFKFFYQIIR